jgi:hypothetical protein
LQNPYEADKLALSMYETYETKGRWADKIAFFSLFIAVLIIAHFIVVLRTTIVLSEPIVIEGGDLSVCIPKGNGWRSEKKWMYQQNAFTLDSFYYPGRSNVIAMVSCRYLIASIKAAPNELFEEKASTIGRSKIAETGQIKMGGSLPSTKDSQNGGVLTLNWAHIESLPISRGGARALVDMFFGVAQLPNNRRLDIEVYQTTDEIDLAEKIFKSVTDSVKFTDNHLLEAGGKIVAEIKNKGLDSFLASIGNKHGQRRENFFLIRDARGSTIGFTMEAMSCPEPEQFRAVSFYYIRGRYDQEQTTFFQSTNNLDEFNWKSQTSGLDRRSNAEIVLGKDGIMTVKELDWQTREKNYQISPAALPDIIGEFTFSQMLDSNQKEIFVDIIGADGKITPALISKTETPRTSALQNQNGTDATVDETTYVFKVELLDGRGFSEQVYLDNQKQILRRLLHQENTYTLERTTAEDILREFPEQGRFLLQNPASGVNYPPPEDALQQKDKIIEQNQPQESNE